MANQLAKSRNRNGNWLSRLFRRQPKPPFPPVSKEQRLKEIHMAYERGYELALKSMRPQQQVAPTNQGKEVSQNYTQQNVITDAFLASVIVYACTTLVARTIASIPWLVFRNGERVTDNKDVLLSLIRRPNKEWTLNKLHQHTLYSKQLWGEAYQTIIRATALGKSATVKEPREGSGNGLPAELWLVKAQYINPVRSSVDEDRLIYEYKDKSPNSKANKAIAAEDMIHHVYCNPDNYYRGLSPLQPTDVDIDIDVAAATWQKSSFSNMAVPPGVWKPKDFLTPTQFDDLVDKIEESWSGVENARTPLVLGGDLEWVDLARTMVEMDFMAGRSYTAQNICTGCGVPPEMIGARESKYRNYETAERVFWTQNALPNVSELAEQYNLQLAPEFGEGYELRPDLSNVDALLRIFGERWEVASKMVERGVPVRIAERQMSLGIDEWPGEQFTGHTLEVVKVLTSQGMPMKDINDLLNLNMKPYHGWDVGYVGSTMIPVDQAIGTDALANMRDE